MKSNRRFEPLEPASYTAAKFRMHSGGASRDCNKYSLETPRSAVYESMFLVCYRPNCVQLGINCLASTFPEVVTPGS